MNTAKQLQDNSPNTSKQCVNRELDCLVSHYVNYREAHNHTPTVPQSVAMSDKYVADFV